MSQPADLDSTAGTTEHSIREGHVRPEQQLPPRDDKLLDMVVAKRRGGESKESIGKQAGNREAQAWNRAEPSTQAHRSYSTGTAEAEVAARKHRQPRTENCNHPLHNPEQARPTQATSKYAKQKVVPRTQQHDRETNRTKEGRRAQVRHNHRAS
jgi:hypothetical protein